MENRIAHLDGLRGIAILSVLLYHAFARWPGLVAMPYGETYAAAFSWGWLGVELFFIISGFVIFRTLDRCESFAEFMGKRWFRLFPAMLAASVLIVATAPLLERPNGTPAVWDLIPGVTFIDSKWLAMIGGPRSLEGTFWTIYAEMKFYVLVGIVYFAAGRKLAVATLLGAFAAYWATAALHLDGARFMLSMFDVSYWAWFACGALFYEWQRDGREQLFVAAVGVGAVASAAPTPGVYTIDNMLFWPFLGAPFVALFAAALLFPRLQQLLSNRALLFVGFISYPLYLIHEEAMIGMIRLMGRAVPGMPTLALPILPVAVLMTTAWIIAVRFEPAIRETIRTFARAAARHFRYRTDARPA